MRQPAGTVDLVGGVAGLFKQERCLNPNRDLKGLVSNLCDANVIWFNRLNDIFLSMANEIRKSHRRKL